jgi:glycosyltransferase involved in cell wall biosynthesis/GR25 family glycosyltransferase involved in LPS biosynthesis
MKKLLIITPHLSTGGQPQFVLKKIESLLSTYDVYCIEYNYLSPDYVVQRNLIKSLIKEKFFSKGEEGIDLIETIKKINPHIIWVEEISETFINNQECEFIYSKDRCWKILESTHTSEDLSVKKSYLPDKFMFVSDWSVNQYEKFNVDSCVIQYPVDLKNRNQNFFKTKLGFSSEYKHVLCVGLFTHGKNQGYAIEIAKSLRNEKVIFHFVGNTASNFSDYWQPLIDNLPDNCVLHGEKENVDEYIQACDLFLFPSKFELNPLVIKEALCYEDLPILMFNLHTYCGHYDKNDEIYFLNGKFIEDSFLLKKILFNSTKTYEDIEGWFSYEWLYDRFIEEAKEGDTIVEIGSWFGKSTKYLSDKITNSKKDLNLISIDTFKGTQNEELHLQIVGGDSIYQDFYNNVDNPNLTVIKDSSHEASKLFNNGSIDYLMIDGDHSYEGVKQDIKDYFYKVKPKGIISGDDYRAFDGVRRAVDEFFGGAEIKTSDNLHWYYKIPKIQLIHMSTLPKQKRAEISISNIKELSRYNIDVTYIQNDLYDGDLDLENYRDPNNTNVNKGHYGCYLAHKQAIYSMSEDYDYTIIMEEDAYIFEDLKTFVDIVHKAIFECVKNEIYFVSFGAFPLQSEVKIYNDLFSECWHQSLAHCYMIPNRYKNWYVDKFENNPWDSADLWFNHVFYHDRKVRLMTNKMYSKQLNGFSLIDKIEKKY